MTYGTAEIRARRELLDSPPESPEELQLYLRWLLNVPCPAEPLDPSHDSPLEMAWDMWEGKDSLVTIASRGSYKTLGASAMEFMVCHYQGLPFLHFAAGDDQVRTALKYHETFADFPWWKPIVDFSLSEIRFESGGILYPRVLSKKNVRSKHVPRVLYDESDEMDPIFYKASINICDSMDVNGTYVKGCTYHISTHNRAKGIVDTLRQQAKTNGRRVRQWNYKDVAEPCTEERHGSGRARVFVNAALLQTRKTPPPKPDGWDHIDVHSNCPECELVATCRGDLVNSRGTRSIDDLVLKITDPMMTPEDWHSQQENLKPSTRGLAVPEWNESEQVREFLFDPELPYGIGVDFSGGEHNAVIIAAQHIPVGWPILEWTGEATIRRTHNTIKNRVRIFDELVVPGGQFNPAMCQTWVSDFNPKYGAPAFAVADPSQLGNTRRAPIGTNGRQVWMEKADNDHKRGYSNVRRLCITQGDDPHPPLEVHPRCERVRLEMGTVRKKLNADGSYSDEVEKKDDDALDGARYVLLHIVTRGTVHPIEANQQSQEIVSGGLW